VVLEERKESVVILLLITQRQERFTFFEPKAGKSGFAKSGL
jgi:hypothetical protein